MPFDSYWGVFTEQFYTPEPEFKVGDTVGTNANVGSWWEHGKIISMNMKTKMAKVEHPNGEIETYGFRQLHKVKER